DSPRQQLEAARKTQSLPFEDVAHDIPADFGVATVQLSNDRIIRQVTEHFATIYQGLGYQTEISYTTPPNHYYRDGNLGFYLKNTNADDAF
ncbi:hypothetical protein CWB76_19790, partial [Pseudoalteromonas sp. S1609]